MGRPKYLTPERSRGFLLAPDPAIHCRVRGRCRAAAEPEPDGVVIAQQPLAPRARDVFDADELEARIQAHIARVERECPPDQRGTNE